MEMRLTLRTMPKKSGRAEQTQRIGTRSLHLSVPHFSVYFLAIRRGGYRKMKNQFV